MSNRLTIAWQPTPFRGSIEFEYRQSMHPDIWRGRLIAGNDSQSTNGPESSVHVTEMSRTARWKHKSRSCLFASQLCLNEAWLTCLANLLNVDGYAAPLPACCLCYLLMPCWLHDCHATLGGIGARQSCASRSDSYIYGLHRDLFKHV